MRIELRRPRNVPKEEGHLYFDDNWLPLILGNDSVYKKNFTPNFTIINKFWVVIVI